MGDSPITGVFGDWIRKLRVCGLVFSRFIFFQIERSDATNVQRFLIENYFFEKNNVSAHEVMKTSALKHLLDKGFNVLKSYFVFRLKYQLILGVSAGWQTGLPASIFRGYESRQGVISLQKDFRSHPSRGFSLRDVLTLHE